MYTTEALSMARLAVPKFELPDPDSPFFLYLAWVCDSLSLEGALILPGGLFLGRLLFLGTGMGGPLSSTAPSARPGRP